MVVLLCCWYLAYQPEYLLPGVRWAGILSTSDGSRWQTTAFQVYSL